MKKVLVMAALAALVATSAFAAVGDATSKHNLSSTGPAAYKTDATEVCVFCHTPHGAATGAATDYLPLWNRTATVSPTGFYNSSSMQHTVSAAITAATDAYLCLSCHDGSTSVRALRNPPNTGLTTTATPISTGAANLGLDMSNDHPIGFVYGGIATDNELKDTPVGIPFFGDNKDEMWCSSCHDVHGGLVGTPFLVINNAGSNLCLACHTK